MTGDCSVTGAVDAGSGLRVTLGAPLGVAVTTLVPGYPGVLAGLERPNEVLLIEDCFGGRARILAEQGQDILALDAPHLFARAGTPYVDADGKDWPDNGMRFAALSRTLVFGSCALLLR